MIFILALTLEQTNYMGVRGLLSYLSPIQTHIHLTHYKGWNVGVDTLYLLYVFREDKERLLRYLQDLTSIPLTLTFVVDGTAEDEKKDCITKRREARTAAAVDAERLQKQLESDTLDEAERAVLEKKLSQKTHEAWHLTKIHKQWFLSVVAALGHTIVKAEKEADSLLASPLYDAVITSDTDILVLGCKRMWIPKKDGGLEHIQYESEDMWRILGLDTRHQLLELAFLAGCDVQTKPILPFDKALSYVRFYGSLFHIHIRHPDIVSEDVLKRFVWLCRGVWASV